MYPFDATELRITWDLFSEITMNERFDGSSSMIETYGKIAGGNARWITEFKPVEYVRKTFFILLLKEFSRCAISCAFIGTSPAYLGVLRSFNKIVLAVAVTTSSFLNKILQRNKTPNRSFRFRPFSFILDRRGVSFIDYKVVHDGTAFLISIHLFDNDNRKPWGRNSALNFVNYIWDNYSILPTEYIRS